MGSTTPTHPTTTTTRDSGNNSSSGSSDEGSSGGAYCYDDADLVLTLPTDDERRHTWALTHGMWGQALSRDDYVRREAYLTTIPLAERGGITQWILTVRGMEPDRRPILSSCESLRKHAVAVTAAAASPTSNGNGHVLNGNGIMMSNGHDADDEMVTTTTTTTTTTEEGIAHGVGGVFTDPQFRRRGYANKMIRMLGARLKGWDRDHTKAGGGGLDDAGKPHQRHAANNNNKDRALFSVLYSDIGKKFYAENGWAPFESTHVTFPLGVPAGFGSEGGYRGPATYAPGGGGSGFKARPIGYLRDADELRELCAVDVRLLREELVRRATTAAAAATTTTTPRKGTSTRGLKRSAKTCVALLPDADQMLWHFVRERFMTDRIFGEGVAPDVNGAVYGTDKGRRMWAVWTRGYYGGGRLERLPLPLPTGAEAEADLRRGTEGNTMFILRFVVEDGVDVQRDDEYVLEGIRAIVGIARAEAAVWRCREVQMWNPTGPVRALLGRSGLPCKFVEREKESIASLMWFGEGRTEDVDWVANEKFGWC